MYMKTSRTRTSAQVAKKPSRAKALPRIEVGVAELRRELARYLRAAEAGREIVIQDRGRDAFVLRRYEPERDPKGIGFGCMRDQTEYTAGTIWNADEAWAAGELP